ncbi:uncharacterized protein LOC110987958 [Acanthaster planci]|uniref:Uncharacterized protein LOC110987958 n=1 Tax=Acanthaster planci TaxID=133434 RepID=A0A8B7ZN18_ACAPL|nr:uncharacterized protein LOC110987958 [Acanthaster planci]
MGACICRPCHNESGIRRDYRPPSHWMSDVSDDRSMTCLSIPGTHESLCLYGGCSLQCQTWSLTRQYEAGIRFVDVRCRHVNDQLVVYHSYVYQHANFDDVLKATLAFLDAHSQETIFMRVRAEYIPEYNTQLFPVAVQMYIDRYPSAKFWSGQTFPTMSEIRGKVMILRDYYGLATFGLPYAKLDIEDMFDVSTLLPKDIARKRESVKRHLEKAIRGPPSTMYLTYSSGTGTFAWPVAVARKINKFLCDFLGRRIGKDKLGIIAMDFPSSELIGKIIDSNFE